MSSTGRTEKSVLDEVDARASWGAAVLRPYTNFAARLGSGKTQWPGGASPAPTKANRRTLAGLGRGGLGGVEVGEDFFGGFAGDDFGQGVEAGALEVGDAAELA